jgi:poly-gamma-glutamate synthesis protein (capsule biosynthesis protein)
MFTFVAAGDILPHMPVVTSARVSGDYDFEPLMRNIRPFIADADLAICHLEVPVAPMGQQPSGYPVFAGPRELVTALSIQGWDGCTTASNHSMDKGFAGVVATLDAFDEYRMGHVGTARTAQEAARAQTYVVRSGNRRINVANIAFSYGTNEMPVPVDAPWSINLFDADSADAQPIIDAAQAARDAGADVVIASVHCCVEYRTEPTPEQRILVERIAESGAVDLYVGHHTHVPQPIEKLAGGPHGDGMWAAFGLGNHLSNQDTQCCRAETNSGVLITATFDVAVDGTVTVGMEWTGTTVDRLDRHTMHILHDVQGGTGRISASDAKARYDRVANAVGPEAAERVEPPTSLADAAFVKKRKPWASEDANS